MKKQRNIYSYQKNRAITRKLYLISLRNSCCEICGYNENLAALDFHHNNPEEKESQLDMRILSNSSMNFIMTEFKKCKLLCSNCHREIHNPELKISKCIEGVENYDNCLKTRTINKPKCVDCGDEISYTYKRCKECSSKNKRKVKRPNLIDLKKEVEKNGYSWCGRKYLVSDKTIKKWLIKNIQ